MQQWLKVSILLCTFGLLREIRPSEPFVTEFLTGDWRNITEETIYTEVYPVGTYSYLAQLVVVFLVTDYLRYKPLIILSGICGAIVYSILLWTESLEWLQVSQFFYGLYLSTEVAYFTYMYAQVDEDKYEQVSSWSRAAALTGRFLSGVSSQLLVSFNLMDFRELNYITLCTEIMSIFWAILLPSAVRSVYFHREVTPSILPSSATSTSRPAQQLKGIRLLWEHARSAYSRPIVVGWSLWYASSMCGFVQIQSYVQFLWKDIQHMNDEEVSLYNGVVEAVLTVLGALAALLAGRIKINLESKFLPFLPPIAAFIQAGSALAATLANEVWISYVGYIVLGVVFHYMITFTSVIIARNLVYDSCFGLIFGINTLVGVGMQSLLTLIVINIMGLSVKEQFMAYAVYYVGLGIFILLVSSTLALKNMYRKY